MVLFLMQCSLIMGAEEGGGGTVGGVWGRAIINSILSILKNKYGLSML